MLVVQQAQRGPAAGPYLVAQESCPAGITDLTIYQRPMGAGFRTLG